MSRNGSGTYTLPTGNPVVSGTTIEATWANTTLSDIASALTDSLSRSGQGGMTAAFRAADGTSSVPGISFSNETTTGLYRAGSADLRLAIATTQIQQWLSTGSAITGTLSVSGLLTASAGVSGNLTGNVTGSISGGTVSGTTGTFSGQVTVNSQLVRIVDNAATLQLFKDSTPTKAARLSFNTAAADGLSLGMFDGTSWIEGVTVSASGDVGVGTTAPTFGSGTGVEIQRAGVATLRIENSAASNSFEVYVDTAANGVNLRGRDSSPMIFWTANTERFRVGSAGQFGIGGANYGTSGQVLASQGASSPPQWITPANGDVTLTGTQTLTNKTIQGGTFTDGYTEEVNTANTGTAYTISLTDGTVQILTLTGNCTFTFPTPTAGRSFMLLLKQDGTGSRTVTWPATVKWPGNIAPTITSAASKLDKYVFTADGTNWYGSNGGQNYTV